MGNEIRKLEPVELSRLPVIDDPSGFWIFGSKSQPDGSFRSGRYLFDELHEYARNLQFERRISLTMETEETELFIGEEMIVYKIDALNVSSVSIDGEVFTNLNNKVLNKKINKLSKVKFKVVRQSTDPTAYLYIYARAKLV